MNCINARSNWGFLFVGSLFPFWGGREGRGPLSFHTNFHPFYSQNQANTSVNLIIKCFCKGTLPAKHGYKEIYWTILYQFQGLWLCSVHVHVVLCHFQTSSMKLLSNYALAGYQLLTGAVTALLLEIQLSWFYKKCSYFCYFMNWIGFLLFNMTVL